jgi:hypothetical protein
MPMEWMTHSLSVALRVSFSTILDGVPFPLQGIFFVLAQFLYCTHYFFTFLALVEITRLHALSFFVAFS